MDPFINTTAAASRLGVSRPRVIQLIAEHQLKAEKFGGRDWMIKVSDIEKLASKKRPPGRPRRRP